MTKTITQAVAARLMQTPWFQDGQDRPYELFMDVPFRSLEENGELLWPDSIESGHLNLDLLICRGKKHEAVLCIMLDTKAQLLPLTDAFRMDLPDLPRLFLYTDPSPGPMEEAKVCDWVCRYVDDKLSQPGKGPVSPYSLPVRSLSRAEGKLKKDLKRLSPDELNHLLTHTQLLTENGDISGYGEYIGLFFRCGTDGSVVSREVVTASSTVEDVNKELFFRQERLPKKAPLAQRLERVKQHLPSDGIYSKRVVDSLNVLLDTPMKDFAFRSDGSLENNLALAEHTLGNITAPELYSPRERTYLDALRTLHDLLKQYRAEPLNNRTRRKDLANLCFAILKGLAEQLSQGPGSPEDSADESLAWRLGHLKSNNDEIYPIAHIHISNYFYAAALRAGIGYPLWMESLVEHGARRYLNPRRMELENLTTYVEWLLKSEQFKPGSPDNYLECCGPFWCLYDMLVQPIIPDASLEDMEIYEEQD